MVGVRRAIVLVLALQSSACGTSVTISYREIARPWQAPRNPDAVAAVYTLPPAGGDYLVVGRLGARQAQWDTASASDLFLALRREAASHGCDAVVIDPGRCSTLVVGTTGGGHDYEVRSAIGVDAWCVAFPSHAGPP